MLSIIDLAPYYIDIGELQVFLDLLHSELATPRFHVLHNFHLGKQFKTHKFQRNCSSQRYSFNKYQVFVQFTFRITLFVLIRCTNRVNTYCAKRYSEQWIISVVYIRRQIINFRTGKWKCKNSIEKVYLLFWNVKSLEKVKRKWRKNTTSEVRNWTRSTECGSGRLSKFIPPKSYGIIAVREALIKLNSLHWSQWSSLCFCTNKIEYDNWKCAESFDASTRVNSFHYS